MQSLLNPPTTSFYRNVLPLFNFSIYEPITGTVFFGAISKFTYIPVPPFKRPISAGADLLPYRHPRATGTEETTGTFIRHSHKQLAINNHARNSYLSTYMPAKKRIIAAPSL